MYRRTEITYLEVLKHGDEIIKMLVNGNNIKNGRYDVKDGLITITGCICPLKYTFSDITDPEELKKIDDKYKMHKIIKTGFLGLGKKKEIEYVPETTMYEGDPVFKTIISPYFVIVITDTNVKC